MKQSVQLCARLGAWSMLAMIASVSAAEPEFETIFNGKDLTGWDGRPGFWTVVDGHIRGETTPENKAPGNTFLIWRGGKLQDFELQISYRIHSGNNSGVQYRSKETAKWVVSGYQAEVQNQLGKTAFLYHEKGRGWLVDVGDFMEIDAAGKKAVVGVVADQPSIIAAPYHKDKDWNHYHFTCRGNHVIHALNGFQTVELIDYQADKDPNSLKQRCLEGVLAVQLHAGGPMKVDFKDIRVKHLTDGYGEARRLFNGKDLSGWSASGDGKAAWSVKPLDDPAATKSNRRTKIEDALNVLACSGKASASLQCGEDVGKNYVLRFQRRTKKSAKSGAPIHAVLGWDTVEATVRGGKTEVRVNGTLRKDAAAPIQNGVPALPGDVKAEYRNVVLIPIVGK
ncbi:MAG: DUF1080 domain-containing protein [Planctomycetales bacterium]